VPSYEFGTNNGPEWAEPAFSQLPTVQAEVKAAGLTLDRVWAYTTDGDATIKAKVKAAKNAGMTCMFELGNSNDLTWMKHVVRTLGNACNLYEFGNEPDNGGSVAGNIQGATSEWIADVPQLRKLNPNALFGGPAITYAESNNGGTSYGSDMAYFLATTAAAGLRADFISYHDYPCASSTSEADCIATTPGEIRQNYNQVVGWEKQYYGKVVPTGMSEYNFDPGTNNLKQWSADSTFMTKWTETALDTVVATHMAFANEYTALDYAGYGNLDMFSDAAPHAPKAQFYAVASEIKKYGGPSTLTLP
jgi:hypothetical protein